MSDIKLFNHKQIRSVWNEEEQWYFSIVDVVEVLTDSPTPRQYWGKLKKKGICQSAVVSILGTTEIGEQRWKEIYK